MSISMVMPKLLCETGFPHRAFSQSNSAMQACLRHFASSTVTIAQSELTSVALRLQHHKRSTNHCYSDRIDVFRQT